MYTKKSVRFDHIVTFISIFYYTIKGIPGGKKRKGRRITYTKNEKKMIKCNNTFVNAGGVAW